GQVLPLFKGAKSVADVKALDDRLLLAKFLRGVLDLKPELKKALATAKTEMLGHVAEGKDKAHVVYKLIVEFDATPVVNITVNCLQKHGAKWMLLLSGDMEGMVAMMKQQVAGKLVMPDMKTSRVEPIGRLMKGSSPGPVYLVYRLVTPIADSQIAKI